MSGGVWNLLYWKVQVDQMIPVSLRVLFAVRVLFAAMYEVSQNNLPPDLACTLSRSAWALSAFSFAVPFIWSQCSSPTFEREQT